VDITSEQHLENGIAERRFNIVGAGGRPVPGVLWTPPRAPGKTPLILMGHGGGLSKDALHMQAQRDYFTGERGIATAAIDAPAHGDRGSVTSADGPDYIAMWRVPGVSDDMNTDWSRTLDALLALDEFVPGSVGYFGLSQGTMFGLPYVASESRIVAAVLGNCGIRGPSIARSGVGERLVADAPRVLCPVFFHIQWDDERFDRDSALELYGLIGSSDKRLQSTPGLHAEASLEARATMRGFLADRLLAEWVPA